MWLGCPAHCQQYNCSPAAAHVPPAVQWQHAWDVRPPTFPKPPSPMTGPHCSASKETASMAATAPPGLLLACGCCSSCGWRSRGAGISGPLPASGEAATAAGCARWPRGVPAGRAATCLPPDARPQLPATPPPLPTPLPLLPTVLQPSEPRLLEQGPGTAGCCCAWAGVPGGPLLPQLGVCVGLGEANAPACRCW